MARPSGVFFNLYMKFLQYNSDSDSQDIISVVGDLTNTDTTQYPLKAITRAINKWNKIVWSWIFEAYGGWLYDDANNTTDFPTAVTDLVLNQVDYSLPSTALAVRGVEIKTVGNVWYPLIFLTEEQIRDRNIAEAQFMNVPAQPKFYFPYAGSFKIYPAANYAQASSLRVSFARGSLSFASTDTTKSPGFISEFHEVLPVGAAYEFAARKGLENTEDLKEQLFGHFTRSGLIQGTGYKDRIKNYYSERYQELFPPRVTVRDYVQEMK